MRIVWLANLIILLTISPSLLFAQNATPIPLFAPEPNKPCKRLVIIFTGAPSEGVGEALDRFESRTLYELQTLSHPDSDGSRPAVFTFTSKKVQREYDKLGDRREVTFLDQSLAAWLEFVKEDLDRSFYSIRDDPKFTAFVKPLNLPERPAEMSEAQRRALTSLFRIEISVNAHGDSDNYDSGHFSGEFSLYESDRNGKIAEFTEVHTKDFLSRIGDATVLTVVNACHGTAIARLFWDFNKNNAYVASSAFSNSSSSDDTSPISRLIEQKRTMVLHDLVEEFFPSTYAYCTRMDASSFSRFENKYVWGLKIGEETLPVGLLRSELSTQAFATAWGFGLYEESRRVDLNVFGPHNAIDADYVPVNPLVGIGFSSLQDTAMSILQVIARNDKGTPDAALAQQILAADWPEECPIVAGTALFEKYERALHAATDHKIDLADLLKSYPMEFALTRRRFPNAIKVLNSRLEQVAQGVAKSSTEGGKDFTAAVHSTMEALRQLASLPEKSSRANDENERNNWVRFSESRSRLLIMLTDLQGRNPFSSGPDEKPFLPKAQYDELIDTLRTISNSVALVLLKYDLPRFEERCQIIMKIREMQIKTLCFILDSRLKRTDLPDAEKTRTRNRINRFLNQLNLVFSCPFGPLLNDSSKPTNR